jgi:peptide/nickel transport system substrate-binding protein
MVKTSTVAIIVVVLIVVVAAYALISREGPSHENNTNAMVLKAVQIADANSLDVDATKMDQAMQIIALTQDTLLTYNNKMNYISLLAESYEIGENGLYIDFYLRHDVKFHSGAPLDAAAVRYSILRAKAPRSVQSDTVADILDVEVYSKYTVRVHLKKWDRWLFDWFAEASSSIVSPALGDDPNYGVTKFDGTGPFKVKEWTKDTKTVLVRNEDYKWGPAVYSNRGPAHLSEIDIIIDTNSLTSEDKFFTGQVNMMIGFSSRPALIQRLQSDSNVNPNFIYTRSSMAWIGFTASSLSPEIQQGKPDNYWSGLNLTPRPDPSNRPKSPLDDNKPWIDLGGGVMTPDNTNTGLMVRRALLYATNRENMLLYGGWENLGKVAFGPLTSEMWGYNPAVENMYPYDPELAKSLLAQAGYPGGSPTNMVLHITGYTATGNTTYVEELVELSKMWKEVGVDLAVQELPFDSIESKIADDSVDIFTGGYTWPNADMLWWYWHTIRVPSGPNRFWWGNAYTNAVIDNTFSFDDNVAFKAIQDAQVLIMEDATYLPVVERPFLLAMRIDVKNVNLTPLNNFDWKLLDATIG